MKNPLFRIKTKKSLFGTVAHIVQKKTPIGYREVHSGSKKECEEFIESAK